MQLAALPRWQWVAIGLIAGLIMGYVNDTADSQLYGINVQGYGMLLPDQQKFENGLVQEYSGIRLFSNPIVYPHWTTDAHGHKKLIYIVSGSFWDGHEEMKDGKPVAEWRPRCIITDTPYRPKIGVSENGGPVTAEYPSVVQFLGAMHRLYKVDYRYAWWALHPILTWTVACLLVIGGIWPTLVNLLAFGRFTRPPEVKAVSLWNIRGSKPRPEPKAIYAPTSTGEPEEEEQDLTPATPQENTDAPAPAVQKLATEQLEAVPQGPADDRSFGAAKDDFYPTERHAPRAGPPR